MHAAVDTSLGGKADCSLVSSSESGGVTTITFSRKLNTGDPYDIVFGNSSLFLLWAYGSTDGSGTSYPKHASTGAGKVNLLLTNQSSTATSNVTTSIAVVQLLNSIIMHPPQFESPAKDFRVWWSTNATSQTVTMTVQARTTGWVGVGFADTPFMSGSDMVVGWVADADMSVVCFDSWSSDYLQPKRMHNLYCE
jgi:hypothetical protein